MGSNGEKYLISKCFGISSAFPADGAVSCLSSFLGKALMYKEHTKVAQVMMTSPFLPTVPSRDVSPPSPTHWNRPTEGMNEAAFKTASFYRFIVNKEL